MDKVSPRPSRRLTRAVFGLMRSSGVFQAVARTSWRQRRFIILVYHGVSLVDEHLWDPDLYLAPGEFRQSLQVIRDSGCTVLPLREAMERLATDDLPPRTVVLTFDDGNYDFHRQALPGLREFGFPATVFIATYYSQFQRPVFNPTCHYLLWKAAGCPIPADDLGIGAAPLRTGNAVQRLESFKRIQALTREELLSGAAKHDLLCELAGRIGMDMEDIERRRLFYLMDAGELASLPKDLIEVQLHTHRHRAPLDRKLFLREILDNRECLEDALGSDRKFDHFCYPSGFQRPEFLPWLRDAGVRLGLTCDVGLVSAKDEPLLLPRVAVTMGLSPVEIEASLSGTRDLLRGKVFV